MAFDFIVALIILRVILSASFSFVFFLFYHSRGGFATENLFDIKSLYICNRNEILIEVFRVFYRIARQTKAEAVSAYIFALRFLLHCSIKSIADAANETVSIIIAA